MKTIYVFIAMMLLFIIIPPENVEYPMCDTYGQSYQEKIIYVFSDIQCTLERWKINLETRIDNLIYQTAQMKSVSNEIYQQKNQSETINTELNNALQQRQHLLNELNNN